MARKPKTRKRGQSPRTREGRVAPAPRSEDRGRYTPPPTKLAYFRPTWHKLVGIMIMALGVAIILINYLDSGAISVLPRGHQEAYFFLGVVVTGAGTWWLGLFDQPV